MGISREQNLLHFIFGGRGFKEEVVSLCETWFDFLKEEGLGCGVKMGGIEQMVCDTFFNGICAGMMAFYNACWGLEFKDCRFLFEFVMEVVVVVVVEVVVVVVVTAAAVVDASAAVAVIVVV